MVDDAFTWTCENSFIVYVSHFGYYIQIKYCCRYSLQGTNFAIVYNNNMIDRFSDKISYQSYISSLVHLTG